MAVLCTRAGAAESKLRRHSTPVTHSVRMVSEAEMPEQTRSSRAFSMQDARSGVYSKLSPHRGVDEHMDEEDGLRDKLAQYRPLVKRLGPGVLFQKISRRTSNFQHTNAWFIRFHGCYVRFGLGHLFKVLLLVTYSFLGAAIFYISERTEEEKVMTNYAATYYNDSRRQLIERIWELKMDRLSKERLTGKAEQALDWYEKRIRCERPFDALTTLNGYHHWDFWNALLYAGTVYTTIGYGHIAPVSDRGRVLTIIYATFGIPLFFALLSDIGQLFARVMYTSWLFVHYAYHAVAIFFKTCRITLYFRKLKKKPVLVNPYVEAWNELKNSNTLERQKIVEEHLHQLPMSVALALTFGWMVMCSAVFCRWETSWTYFTAFYFFFVSLTTIGLGDLVPERSDYMLMSFGLVVIGLALVSMCIRVAEAKVDFIGEQTMQKILKTYQSAQIEGEQTTFDDAELQREMHTLESPWMKPWLGKHRKNLAEVAHIKAMMRVVGTQTEDDDWVDVNDSKRVPARKAMTCSEPCMTTLPTILEDADASFCSASAISTNIAIQSSSSINSISPSTEQLNDQAAALDNGGGGQTVLTSGAMNKARSGSWN